MNHYTGQLVTARWLDLKDNGFRSRIETDFMDYYD